MSQVILLQRVEKLGNMGDVVDVKPGYARNYLLPQGKALRATKTNLAYFEAEKKAVEQQHADTKKEAEKLAKKLPKLENRIERKAAARADEQEIKALKFKRYKVNKKMFKVELQIALMGATDEEDAERITAEFRAERQAEKAARKAANKAARKAAKAAAEEAAEGGEA